MYTRLSYVQAQLSDVILDQLPKLAGRMFDVLKFSDSVGMWAPGLLPANTSNAASATQYVASWVANGGTSTLAALGAAYKPDGVEAVYLLSDGVPSDAQPSQIIAMASTLSKNGTVPCNTILFMEGGTEDRAAAESFMKTLAEATGGVFRSASNR
jgi:Mg-chelatase subunit ChlD